MQYIVRRMSRGLDGKYFPFDPAGQFDGLAEAVQYAEKLAENLSDVGGTFIAVRPVSETGSHPRAQVRVPASGDPLRVNFFDADGIYIDDPRQNRR
jgi:hypothetical protein